MPAFERPTTGRVAAIVTCHNYGAHLRECLDSLLTQTARPCEIVLFVDADKHLPAEYIATGLAWFDSPNVAVVYSDLERFGGETGRVSFPGRFDGHLFGNGVRVTQ